MLPGESRAVGGSPNEGRRPRTAWVLRPGADEGRISEATLAEQSAEQIVLQMPRTLAAVRPPDPLETAPPRVDDPLGAMQKSCATEGVKCRGFVTLCRCRRGDCRGSPSIVGLQALGHTSARSDEGLGRRRRGGASLFRCAWPCRSAQAMACSFSRASSSSRSPRRRAPHATPRRSCGRRSIAAEIFILAPRVWPSP